MNTKAILTMLCAALLVYVPIAEPAPTAAPALGQVMARGELNINGAPTPSGGTLFSGDIVGTGANAIAELVFSDSNKVFLPQTSAVALSNDAGQVIVQLKAGSLAVLSKSAAPVFIKPAANAPIVMEVAALGNSSKVAMRRGSATVETADKILDVPEGKELDATTAASSPASPQVTASGRSALATWVLIGSAAAGITGLALGAVAISRPNPSNCTAVSAGTITCP